MGSIWAILLAILGLFTGTGSQDGIGGLLSSLLSLFKGGSAG